MIKSLNQMYNLRRKIGFSLVGLLISVSANSQMKIGSNPTTINSNSVLEMESLDKGMLLPRVSLSNTTSFAPLSANVEGMVVYNIATAGDVTPGFYYNDGTKWVRIASPASTTNALTNPSNTITSTVNGIVATTPAVNTVSNAFNGTTRELSTTVNGVVGAGVVIPTTNTLANSANTITSTVNGVASTTSAVNTVSNTFNTTTRELSTMVNGLAGAGVVIPTTQDSTSVSNGLTMTGLEVRLGGPLTFATTITTSPIFTLALAGLQSGASSDSIVVANPTTGVLARRSPTAFIAAATTNTLTGTGSALTSTVNGVVSTLSPSTGTIASGNTLGFDASGNLVKGLGNSPDSTTSSNGLTMTGKDVRLGGTLTGATTVTTSAANTLALAGLQSGASSDSILVVNPTTGVIARKSPTAITTTNTMSSSVNTMTNTTNGVVATAPIVNSVANAFNTTTRELTTTINGVAGTAVVLTDRADSTTSSNGLTMTGKDVRLGGTLTGATTVTTSAANTLALAGLQLGSSTDSVVVASGSTGILKKISLSMSNRLGVVTTTSTSFTIPDSADVVIYTGTGAATFTLPNASSSYGRELRILNYASASTNTPITLSSPVNVEGNAVMETSTIINSKDTTADFPLGMASRNINTVTLISNGTSWFKLGN